MVAFSKLTCLAASAVAQRELFVAPVPANPGFLSQRAAEPQMYAPVYAAPNGFEYASYEEPSQGWGWTAILSAVAAGALAGRTIGQYLKAGASTVDSSANVDLEVATLALAGRLPALEVATLAVTAKKPAPKKPAPKKVVAPKKAVAVKKVAPKKVAPKKGVAKKAVVRKLAPKKSSGVYFAGGRRDASTVRQWKPGQNKNEFCYGLPGNIAPAGNWDPLNLLEGLDELEVLRRREAELTHGRVAMLASLGFLTQESFHPLFGGEIGGPAINQIPEIPTPMWFIMTLGIGIAETQRIQLGWANPYENNDNIQRLKPGYYPGDLGWDPLNIAPTDPAEFRAMQERELSHGRLAMLAAAGFLAQETVTQQPWLATLAVAGKDTEFCYGLPGNIPPMGNWDPLNLLEGKDKGEVMRWREAELTHGRVSMVASLGFLTQESFHPLFGGNIEGPAINQIPEIPPLAFVFITIGIANAEIARIQAGWADPRESKDNVQRLKPGYTPGDLGFDPLGIRPEDPAEFRKMQERELSHGRLAMLAAAGFIAQEYQTQVPWVEGWSTIGQ